MADEALATSPKKKKLPFKPTALRRAAAPKPSQKDEGKESDDDNLALFRRAKEMAPTLAADVERRRRRRQQKEEEERRRAAAAEKRPRDDTDEPEQTTRKSVSRSREPSQHVEQQPLVLGDDPAVDESMTVKGDSFSELVTPPPSKRSRLGSAASKRPSASVEPPGSSLETSPSTRHLRSQYTSPTKRLFRNESSSKRSAPIISIDSDSDDDVKPSYPSGRAREDSIAIMDEDSPAPFAPEPEPEEDEFAEYIRKAEEKQKNRARDQAFLDDPLEDSPKKESTEIYISSIVPGTKPVVFKFLFGKELRLARDTWIALQNKQTPCIPADQQDGVVLTWRRSRVYNSSCLLDLGIRPQSDGRLFTTSQGRDGLSSQRHRVHMEAWTQELFQQMEHEEGLKRRREAGEISDIEEELEEAVEEVKMRIILKARDLEPVKLTIRPETTVETLVTGFRAQRNIGSDRDVSLWFDGDKLEEHVTMDDAGIEDMEMIEVHIK